MSRILLCSLLVCISSLSAADPVAECRLEHLRSVYDITFPQNGDSPIFASQLEISGRLLVSTPGTVVGPMRVKAWAFTDRGERLPDSSESNCDLDQPSRGAVPTAGFGFSLSGPKEVAWKLTRLEGEVRALVATRFAEAVLAPISRYLGQPVKPVGLDEEVLVVAYENGVNVRAPNSLLHRLAQVSVLDAGGRILNQERIVSWNTSSEGLKLQVAIGRQLLADDQVVLSIPVKPQEVVMPFVVTDIPICYQPAKPAKPVPLKPATVPVR